MTSPLFRSRPETESLVKFLTAEAENGEGHEISYGDLSEVAGTDVTSPSGRGYLMSARNRVLRDRDHVWGCRRGFGLFLVENGERVKHAEFTAGKVRRACRKSRDVLLTVKTQELSPEELNGLNVGLTRLALMSHTASTKVKKKLAKQISESTGISELPLTKAIDLLRKAKVKKKRGQGPE